MEKKKVYDIVVERIMDTMAKGTVPWKAKWSGQMPMNYASKRPYKGIMNNMLLSGSACPYFMTYKQITEKKGKVLKGEKPYIVTYYRISDKVVEDKDGEKKLEQIFILLFYKVWSLDQTDLEIPPDKYPENKPLKLAESVIKGYKDPPKIIEGGYNPCYSPSADVIRLPPITQFFTSNDYYSTLFHEAIHSTGHASRLDRFKEGVYGGDGGYSKEELVAEIGASYLKNICGIATPESEENSAAYLKHWWGRLQNNQEDLRYAVKQAWPAVKRILGDIYAKE